MRLRPLFIAMIGLLGGIRGDLRRPARLVDRLAGNGHTFAPAPCRYPFIIVVNRRLRIFPDQTLSGLSCSSGPRAADSEKIPASKESTDAQTDIRQRFSPATRYVLAWCRTSSSLRLEWVRPLRVLPAPSSSDLLCATAHLHRASNIRLPTSDLWILLRSTLLSRRILRRPAEALLRPMERLRPRRPSPWVAPWPLATVASDVRSRLTGRACRRSTGRIPTFQRA